MNNYPEIIVGTYEEFLLGFKITKDNDGQFKLTLDMASHAHQGSIRCLASHGELLASSGADEYVNVFDITTRKEIAVLTPHNGTVTALLFTPDGSHIISGSQDGAIVVLRCSDWSKMKVWNEAHKKANGVVGLSIHPTGKLLLSIGADHILRVWNLVKGRQAYAVNFGKRISPGNTLNYVTWSFDGSHYAIGLGQTVEVYSTNSAATIYTVQASSRISSFDLSQESIIAIGRDDGAIELHNIDLKQQILEEKAHEKRIKCLQFFEISDEELYLVSADSQGIIKLWRWKRHRKVQKLIMEAMVDADCRILCLTLSATRQQKEMSNKSSSNETTHEEITSLNNKKQKEKKRDELLVTPLQESTNESVVTSNKKKRKSNDFEITRTPKSMSLKRSNKSTSDWNVT